MAEIGLKHTSKKVGNEKCGSITILLQTVTRKILSFQLVYTRTEWFFPVEFLDSFCLSYNPKHWSNEDKTIRSLKKVFNPYFYQVRKELGLLNDQKVRILCGALKGHSTDKVTIKLKR